MRVISNTRKTGQVFIFSSFNPSGENRNKKCTHLNFYTPNVNTNKASVKGPALSKPRKNSSFYVKRQFRILSFKKPNRIFNTSSKLYLFFYLISIIERQVFGHFSINKTKNLKNKTDVKHSKVGFSVYST